MNYLQHGVTLRLHIRYIRKKFRQKVYNTKHISKAYSMKKVILAASVLMLLAAGCNSQTSVVTTPAVNDTPTDASQTNPAPTEPPIPAQNNVEASANSNADLNASLKAIDTNMTSLNGDSANIDSSLSEQQAPTK